MRPGPLARLSRILCEALKLHLVEKVRPRVPEAGRILWNCFADLSEGRRIGEAGPEPILLTEFAAWAALHKCPLEARHLAVIRALDRVWLDNARNPEAQPITPEGFDAVFG